MSDLPITMLEDDSGLVCGTVLVRLHRPEGYEDVHPELLLEDAGIHPAFKPELVTPPNAPPNGDANSSEIPKGCPRCDSPDACRMLGCAAQEMDRREGGAATLDGEQHGPR